MNRVFEAKLKVAPDAPIPPMFDGTASAGPADSFVVCQGLKGEAASTFGDLVWDFTAYTTEGRGLRLYFAYWGRTPATPAQSALSREIRRATFSLIWHRPGAPLSLGTIGNYVTVLCAAATHAESHGTTLGELLNAPVPLLNFVRTHCSGWMGETLGSLLGVLANIGADAVGFAVAPSKTISEIKTLAKAYRAGIKQHAPMPTRIYSAFLSSLQRELAAWLSVAPDLLPLFQSCAADRFMGRSWDQQRFRIAKKVGVTKFERRPTFDELCPPSVAAYLVAAGKPLQVKSLSFVVTEIQLVCKLTAQAFSGMRDDEVSSLPYDCLETTVANGKTHHILKGRTTKFNHGLPKRAQWVTNKEGQQAVLAAQAIADAIYSAMGVSPEPLVGRTSKTPLFVSAGYTGMGSAVELPVAGQWLSGLLGFVEGSTLVARLLTTIEEGDLKELEQIDPHRAWRSEESYQVGAPWSFKTHQLRRSLALFAQRSGLVSLPSLRRQLQHLTEEMARYYAKGSAFAKDFIGSETDHFGLEWQKTQPESSALSYILNVLLSNDVLFGGHANWVQHQIKGANGVVLVDRAATMRRFHKGESAYKETLIGGCTNTEECDKVALRWLDVDCLRDDCRNMVCNLTKLERVIAAQARLVSALDPASIEFRTEKDDLAVFVAARDKARQTTQGDQA